MFLSTIATNILVVIVSFAIIWYHYHLYQWFNRIHFGNEKPKDGEDVKGSPRMYVGVVCAVFVDILIFYFIFLG
tara:strand:- start:413 stop:634 length:222 start_codon:yes stop_codon:yes gene_type:complete